LEQEGKSITPEGKSVISKIIDFTAQPLLVGIGVASVSVVIFKFGQVKGWWR
jgi:hypothetical protein